MATKWSKPVTREVTTLRGAPLMVTLDAHGVGFREKGRRKKFTLPYGPAFMSAVRLSIAQQKAEKKKARMVRRGKI